MIGDYPNPPDADNQPIFQQPLILPGYAENAQEPFLDAQPTTMDAQQAFLDVEQPFDMQGSFAPAHQSQFGYPSLAPRRPEYLYGQSFPPFERPFDKLVKLWHSDPAYKVFFVALATVLVSGLVCILLISSMFKQSSSSQTPIADKMTTMSASSPVNIPTLMATPTPLSTPTVETTTPPAPSPPAPLQLNVEITSIPSIVVNGTTTSLAITTNEPGAEVALHVTYSNAIPTSYKGAIVTTNGNGQATLFWPVKVRPNKKSSKVTAHVTVFAQDANGQTAASQMVTVQVLAF